MKSWKITWIKKEFFTKGNFRLHAEAVSCPSKFYFALIYKLFPFARKCRFILKLNKGGAIEINEFMSLFIYREVFIDGCYDNLQLSVKNPNIVDIGANTGMFAIRMKQLYPDASVFCFEPYPPNFNELQRNINRSNLKNVQLFNKGVGKESGIQKLYIHDKNIGGHSMFRNLTEGGRSIDMTIVNIQFVVDLLKDNSCDYLKLDCEGAEFEIIKSLDKILCQQFPRIIFEPTPTVYDVNEVVAHLTQLGYTVTKIEKHSLYLAILNS